jgi:hypothetical protein
MLSLGTPNAFLAIACCRHPKRWQRQVYRLVSAQPIGRLDQTSFLLSSIGFC